MGKSRGWLRLRTAESHEVEGWVKAGQRPDLAIFNHFWFIHSLCHATLHEAEDRAVFLYVLA